MSDDKLLKARLIIAKLIAHYVFNGWENDSRSDVLEMIYKLNEDLSLGINPPSVLNTMIEHGIIFNNGTYEGEPIYSLKQAKEQVTL